MSFDHKTASGVSRGGFMIERLSKKLFLWYNHHGKRFSWDFMVLLIEKQGILFANEDFIRKSQEKSLH